TSSMAARRRRATCLRNGARRFICPGRKCWPAIFRAGHTTCICALPIRRIRKAPATPSASSTSSSMVTDMPLSSWRLFAFWALPIFLLLAQPIRAADTPDIYEAKSAAIDTADEVTLEAWVKIDPSCPEGARIFDKTIPGRRESYRLEVGKNRTIRFIAGRAECESKEPLATDRVVFVAAVLAPAAKMMTLYID